MSGRARAANPARTARRAGAFLRSRGGTATLEFGLIVPILIMATLGLVDFGRAMWTNNTLARAATEAVRYAAIRGAEKPAPATLEQIRTVARDRAVGLDPAALTIVVDWTPDNAAGSTVSVQVSYQFDFLLIGFLPLDPLSLSRSSTLVIG